MKFVSLAILFIFSNVVYAEMTFKINGKKVSFFQEQNLQITASTECELNKNSDGCKNFPFLKTVSIEKLGRIPAGNPNSGALICEDQLGGDSVIGFDDSENQRSFCYLAQQNVYIDNGTLSHFARKNDGFYENMGTFNPSKSKPSP